MSRAVLVRSTMRTWDLILLVMAGLIAGVVGAVLIENNEGVPGKILALIGALTVIGGMCALQWRMATRQWVRVGSDGFTIIDRRGETDYEDSQVQSLALQEKHNYLHGIHKSTTRTLILWLDAWEAANQASRLEFRSTRKSAEHDPLSDLMERLLEQVLHRAVDLLNAGQTFSGRGWKIDRQTLVFETKAEPRHCPLDEIVMTAIVDQDLCLWRRNHDEAWARVKIDDVNAPVLKCLLDARLSDRPQETPSDGEGLGRVVFERKSGAVETFLLALASFTLMLLGTGLLYGALTGRNRGEQVGLTVGGIAILLAAIACLLGFLHFRRFAFRCHQFGLIKRGLFNERKIRYQHVEAFTFKATRVYVNAVYSHTSLGLDFEPDADHQSQRIQYTVSVPQVDEELIRLRDQIAAMIGTRIWHAVDAGQKVEWTPALSFHQQHLAYTPSGWFGQKATVSIPITEISQFRVNEGQCELFVKGQAKAVIQEQVDARNFFPGLHCLLLLIQATQADQPLPETAE